MIRQSTPEKQMNMSEESKSSHSLRGISNIDGLSHMSQKTKGPMTSSSSLGNIFKLGVSNLIAEQSTIKKVAAKKKEEEKASSTSVIKEITADNILKAKNQKNERELRAEGKNILHHLCNF